MSYNVNGSGHNADIEKVKEAFADFVDALDEATAEGGVRFNGTISGSEGSEAFTVTAEDVRAAGDESAPET